jgi:hypothetical protein
MEQIGELLRVSCIGCCGLLALFMILLALPQSRLRYYVLRGLGIVFFTVTGLLPDVIPVLGQIDDGGALIGAIITGLSGALAWWNSRKSKAYRSGGPPQLPPAS